MYGTYILSHSIYHSDPKHKDRSYINIEYIWYVYFESLHTTLTRNIRTFCILILNMYGTYILRHSIYQSYPKHKDRLYINIEQNFHNISGQ